MPVPLTGDAGECRGVTGSPYIGFQKTIWAQYGGHMAPILAHVTPILRQYCDHMAAILSQCHLPGLRGAQRGRAANNQIEALINRNSIWS